MKQSLLDERERAAEKYNQKLEELHEMLEQQRLSEENKIKLLEQQQAKFEQIQREAEETTLRRNEELRAQLRQENGKDFEEQNKVFQKQLTEKIAENQRQSEAIERMRKEQEQIRNSINNINNKNNKESGDKSGECVIS
jgi:hypothetical protein